MSQDLSTATFLGCRRENDRVGVRNHVIILPVDDLANSACEAVANNICGTMAFKAYMQILLGQRSVTRLPNPSK